MQPSIERRQHHRQAVSINGTAVAQEGVLRIMILIVDLSSSGARVQLPMGIDARNEITLLFDHRAEPSTIVWREGNVLGLKFQQPFHE